MRPVDNFDLIIPLLNFESEDEFYYLQILQRKKENELLTSNSHVIKNYFITSVEYLERIREEIITLCKQFNARASIRLNKRSFKQCAFKSLKKITDQILNEDYKSVKNFYSRVCGQYHKDSNKTWIVDVDDMDNNIDVMLSIIDGCQPEGEKLVAIIPSKSGLHLIVKPFNMQQFKLHMKGIDLEIHRNNPTNLYIP